jgi:hypothetical protein
VDAVRVFSESQTNVLGIAAFLTRSILLGHAFLVLDDPVQSMDDKHFRTLAKELFKKLLANGIQVIILTHNDEFARIISYAHSNTDNYATLSTRESRRKGCWVVEGNRRVSERLSRAEKCADEGNYEEAWRLIRLALERMYTLVKAASEPSFEPMSWKDQTLEYMWEDGGVGVLIEAAVPGSRNELKDICRQTAGGAHDKKATGDTDVIKACKFIRSLFTPLRLKD